MNIPSDIYPPPVTVDEKWYQDLLDAWSKPDCHPDNYADYFQLKSSLRYATYAESVRNDVTFWIKLMESLALNTPIASLRRRATYEITVASLIDLSTLICYEQRLREYFKDISSHPHRQFRI